MKKLITISLIALVFFVSLTALINNPQFSMIQNQNHQVHIKLTHQATSIYSMDFFNQSGSQYLNTIGNETLTIAPQPFYLNFIGEFDIQDTGSAYGIAINSTGYFYITDNSNNKVKIFTPSGVFVKSFDITHPIGIDINSTDFVYVMDNLNHRIQVFDAAGNNISAFGAYGEDNGWDNGWGLSINASDFVYGCDRDAGVVKIFDKAGNWLKSSYCLNGTEYLYRPQGIFVNASGYVYLCDSGNKEIKVYDMDLNFLYGFGSPGTGESQFNYQSGIVEANGFLFITDKDNNRVKIHEPNGAFVLMNGTEGSGDNEFEQPLGIVLNSTDFIFICDSINSRVVIYQYNATPLYESPGSYLSPILDLGIANNYHYNTLTSYADLPSDSDLAISVSVSADNESWAAYTNVPLNTSIDAELARFLRFYLNFTASSDNLETPTFCSLDLNWTGGINNSLPVISDIQVTFDNETMEATISVYIFDDDNDTMDIMLCLPLATIIQTILDQVNGTEVVFEAIVCNYTTEYEYYVNVTDSEDSVQSSLFGFLTGEQPSTSGSTTLIIGAAIASGACLALVACIPNKKFH